MVRRFLRAVRRRPPTAPLTALALLAGASLLVPGRLAGQMGNATNPVGPPADDRLTIARVKFTGGGDWYNDPAEETNLLAEVARRSPAHVQAEKHVVALSDPDLFSYPCLFLTGHGKVALSAHEAERLRHYLEAGGFLYADDDFGMDPSFRKVLADVLPDRPLVELPFSHPIYHVVYDFSHGPPKTHEHAPGPSHGYGVFIGGRLAVFYTFNCNPSDGWTEAHNDPPEKREEAIRMGVNIAWFVLTG